MAIYKRHSTKYNKYITALCPCRWCQTSRKLALASPFSSVILDSKCVGVKVFLKLRKLSDFTPVISQVYLKTTNLYTPIYSQELPLTAGSCAGTSFGWSSSWAEPRSLKKPDTLNILPRKSNISPENQWCKMKFPKWSLSLPRKLTNGTQEWRFDSDIVVLFKGVFSGSNFQPFLRGFWGVYTWDFAKASQGWNSTSSSEGWGITA